MNKQNDEIRADYIEARDEKNLIARTSKSRVCKKWRMPTEKECRKMSGEVITSSAWPFTKEEITSLPSFFERLDFIRKRENISVKGFCEKYKIPYQSYRNWKDGKKPYEATIKRIALCMDLPERLFTEGVTQVYRGAAAQERIEVEPMSTEAFADALKKIGTTVAVVKDEPDEPVFCGSPFEMNVNGTFTTETLKEIFAGLPSGFRFNVKIKVEMVVDEK